MVIKRYKIAGVQVIEILITTSAAHFNREDAGITQHRQHSMLCARLRTRHARILGSLRTQCAAARPILGHRPIQPARRRRTAGNGLQRVHGSRIRVGSDSKRVRCIRVVKYVVLSIRIV